MKASLGAAVNHLPMAPIQMRTHQTWPPADIAGSQRHELPPNWGQEARFKGFLSDSHLTTTFIFVSLA